MQILAGLFFLLLFKVWGWVWVFWGIFVDLFFGVFLRAVEFVWRFWLVFLFVYTVKALLIRYIIV